MCCKCKKELSWVIALGSGVLLASFLPAGALAILEAIALIAAGFLCLKHC